MRKLIDVLRGIDTGCHKIPYATEDEARRKLAELKQLGRPLRSVHFCPEHKAWHLSRAKP